jgi:hypothetical protein
VFRRTVVVAAVAVVVDVAVVVVVDDDETSWMDQIVKMCPMTVQYWYTLAVITLAVISMLYPTMHSRLYCCCYCFHRDDLPKRDSEMIQSDD